MEKDWLNSLKKRMADYEEPVPAGLWDDIDSAVRMHGSGRREVVFFPWLLRAASAAAVLLGLFAGIRLLIPGSDPEKIAVVPGGPVPVPEEKISEVAGDSPTSIETAKITDLQESSSSSHLSSPSSVNKRGRRTSSAENVESVRNLTARAEVPMGQEKAETAANSAMAPIEQHPDDAVSDSHADVLPILPPDVGQSHESEDWSGYVSASLENESRAFAPDQVGLDFSGGATGTKSSSTYSPMMFYRGAAPNSNNSAPEGKNGDGMVSVLTRATGLAPPAVTDYVDHKRPMRAGVSFCWHLNKTLGVETGLTYSMLKSTFSTVSGATVSEDAQLLRYLGLPLDLTASLLNTRYLSLYASAGGMVEKCISGEVKTRLTVDGERTGNAELRKLRVDPLQWSVNAAAGLQFNVTSLLGLYAEPGVSYRFANKSTVQSIYTSRPVDFVFTFGLRFSFR